MNSQYSRYLESKIRDTRVQCDIVKHAIAAVDTHAGLDDFMVANVGDDGRFDDFLAAHFVVDRQSSSPRIAFSGFVEAEQTIDNLKWLSEATSVWGSKWRKLYVEVDGRIDFDPYCAQYLEPADVRQRCAEIADNINLSGAKQLVATGWLAKSLPLLHELQTRGVEIVRSTDDIAQVSTRQRIDVSQKLRNRQVGTNISLTLGEMMRSTPAVAVPLDASTLSAPFFGDKSWGDILPDLSANGAVAGVDVKFVNLRAEFDVFNNVFLEVRSVGSTKPTVVHIHAPFGTVDARRTPSPAPHPQKGPQRSVGGRKPEALQTRPSTPKTPVRSAPLDRFFIGNSQIGQVEIPVGELRKSLEKQPLEKLVSLDGEITRIYNHMIDSELIVADTNFWIACNDENPDQMMMLWVIEKMVDDMRSHNGAKFWLHNYVYEEIYAKSRTMASAKQAKDYIVRVLQPLNLVDIPGITSEPLSSHFADPKLFDSIEMLVSQGRRLAVVTDDADAMARFWGNILNKYDKGSVTEPLFLLRRDLLTVMALRGRIRSRLAALKQNKKPTTYTHDKK